MIHSKKTVKLIIGNLIGFFIYFLESIISIQNISQMIHDFFFVVRSQFPILDEPLYKMKILQISEYFRLIYEHSFQHSLYLILPLHNMFIYHLCWQQMNNLHSYTYSFSWTFINNICHLTFVWFLCTSHLND